MARGLPRWPAAGLVGYQTGTREEEGTHLVENVLQPLLRQCRALDILDGPQLPREPLALLVRDGPLLLPSQLLYHLRVVSQIDLRPDDEARDPRTVVVHFGKPLLLDVLERGGGCDAEADEEHVRLRV